MKYKNIQNFPGTPEGVFSLDNKMESKDNNNQEKEYAPDYFVDDKDEHNIKKVKYQQSII